MSFSVDYHSELTKLDNPLAILLERNIKDHCELMIISSLCFQLIEKKNEKKDEKYNNLFIKISKLKSCLKENDWKKRVTNYFELIELVNKLEYSNEFKNYIEMNDEHKCMQFLLRLISQIMTQYNLYTIDKEILLRIRMFLFNQCD